MKTLQAIAAAGAFALLAVTPVSAQAPMPYGAPISVAQAKKALAAAEAEAAKNNWPVAISIIDSGGHLIAFSRMDNTQIASIRIAHGKARTALEFRRPSKVFQEMLAKGGDAVRFLSVPGLTALEGGVLIVSEGKIIGAVGVSGVASQDDAKVAQAAADAAQ